jgi:DNA-binding NarL/FixJ family response regulator
MKTVIRVGILDDSKAALPYYNSFLSSQIDIDVVFAFSGLEELQLKRESVNTPDLLIMDLEKEENCGIESLPMLIKSFPGCKIIVLTSSEEKCDVILALKRGAVGYIIKSTDGFSLYGAIKTTMETGSYISPEAAWNVVKELQKNPGDALEGVLSKREKEVVAYLKNGLSYKEIAAEMFISVHAVNQHLKKIYKKLKVKSKGELLAKYFQHQLVS